MFLSSYSSAFWVSINCFLVAIFSFFIQFGIKSNSNSICDALFKKLSQSGEGSDAFATMSSSAVSQMVKYFSDGFKKYSLFLIIAGVILMIVHIFVSKPLQNKSGTISKNYNDHYFDNDIF